MTLLHQAAQKAVELKLCPFCGGMAYRHELIEHYPASADGPAGSYSAWFHIGCNVCGIEVGDEYESSAVAVWNRRAPPALQHQEVPREPVALIDRETVIRLAREAVSNGDGSELSGDAIERFAQLVFLEAASPSTTRQQEVGSGPVAQIRGCGMTGGPDGWYECVCGQCAPAEAKP